MQDDSSSRIVAALESWIAAATPGARLPSTRSLASEHGASPVTVQQALRRLVDRGAIETRPGVGTFVRAARSARPVDYGWQTAALSSAPARTTVSATMRSAADDVIALHSGYPDRELLPERLVRAALTRAARSDAVISRSPVAGLPELQSWFAQELGELAPAGVTPPSPGNVIVLPGSQSGLSSVFTSLVAGGQALIVESPTYWGAISAATHAGARLVPVPSGPEGPDPAELDRAFRQSGARLFYAQPTYANPTGAQWSADRAAEILDVVRRNAAFLIEDDWAHDFGITTSPRVLAAQDDTGHVIYLRSLTKSVSPALRIAAVIARGPVRDRLLANRAAESMYVSGLLQAAALDVVTQPGWRTHLRGLRDQLRARRDLLLDSLHRYAPEVAVPHLPAGGINLWARLGPDIEEDRLAQDCRRAGLLVAPGQEWFPAEPSGPHLRLNYTGPNPAAFPEAARILAESLARQ